MEENKIVSDLLYKGSQKKRSQFGTKSSAHFRIELFVLYSQYFPSQYFRTILETVVLTFG